jgi:hypothetical protein
MTKIEAVITGFYISLITAGLLLFISVIKLLWVLSF